MSSNLLVVPVHLDAVVVSPGNSTGPMYSLVWSPPDYTLLSKMQSPLSTLGDPAPMPGADRSRVVLHWSLPDALTRGDYSGAPRFPLVPDRWLVVRFDAGTGANLKRWVIESDYLSPTDGTSPMLDPFGPPAPDPKAFTKMGRARALEGWAEASPAHPSFLTAVAPGNMSFAAFAPACLNVFAFIDDTARDGATYSYAVIGWHREASADPLASIDLTSPKAPADFAARLQALGWVLGSPADGAAANTTRYHAQVNGVDTSSAKVLTNPAPTNLRVVVGNTAVDALARLVEMEASDQSYAHPELAGAWKSAGATLARAIEALGYDRLDTLEKPDAEARLSMETRDHWFSASPGGLRWELVTDSSNAPPLSAEEQAAVDAWLASVNAAQRARDEQLRTLHDLQAKLHAAWWTWKAPTQTAPPPPPHTGSTPPPPNSLPPRPGTTAPRSASTPPPPHSAAPPPPNTAAPSPSGAPSGASTPTPPPAALDPKTPGSLANQVWALASALSTRPPTLPPAEDARRADASPQQRADALRQWLDGAFTLPNGDKLSARLRSLRLTGEPRFHRPADPVVLIRGLDRARRHGEDGRERPDGLLACRLGDQLLPGGAVPATQLPSLCDALVAEAIALDSSAPPAGTRPAAFAVGAWTQGWSPLLLDWQLRFIPTAGLADWRFDGERFRWLGSGLDDPKAFVYAGQGLLTPHAEVIFGRRVRDLLQDSPLLSGPTGPQLRTMIQDIAGWDVLAQSLTGFTDALLTRSARVSLTPPGQGDPLPPYSEDPAAPLPSLGALIGEQFDWSPAAPTGAPFAPLRAGFAELASLEIYDSFGQKFSLSSAVYPARALWPDEPTNAAGQTVHLRDLLSAQVNLSGFLQLPPRLSQSARLTLRFLGQGDPALDLPVSPSPNPICGWLLPNHLDQSLAVYDAGGAYLGEILPTSLAVTSDVAAQVSDPTLRKVVATLEKQRANLDDVLQSIDETLWLVDPLGARKDAMLSVLAGRPLAVVRASVQLTLEGPPAEDQHGGGAGGVTELQLNVRLGSVALRDDGLMGYFLHDDPSDASVYEAFYAVRPTPERASNDSLLRAVDTGASVPVKVNGDPVILTMILDPRAGVHADCGLLPVTRATLPEAATAEIGAKLRPRFTVGPLLAPPDRLTIPKPGELRGSWSLLSAGVPIVDADRLAPLAGGPRVLLDDWLELDP